MHSITHFVFSKHRASLLVAIIGAIFAQTAAAQNMLDVAKPDAVVPPLTYRSVFKETSQGVEKDTLDWRKANNDVGRFTRGHVDILKEEERELAKPMALPMTKPTSEPAADAAAPKPAGNAPPDKNKAAPAHKH